jgi:hypothetical protein
MKVSYSFHFCFKYGLGICALGSLEIFFCRLEALSHKGVSSSAAFFVSLALLFKFFKFLVELFSERLFCCAFLVSTWPRISSIGWPTYFGKAILASFLALCPRLDSVFPVIVACLEEGEIIIDAVGSLCMACSLPAASFRRPPMAVQISLPNIRQSQAITLKRSSAKGGFEVLVLGDLPNQFRGVLTQGSRHIWGMSISIASSSCLASAKSLTSSSAF